MRTMPWDSWQRLQPVRFFLPRPATNGLGALLTEPFHASPRCDQVQSVAPGDGRYKIGPEFPPPTGGQCGAAGERCQGVSWSNYGVRDVVKIPGDLKPGKYILGFRYDCEATAQVSYPLLFLRVSVRRPVSCLRTIQRDVESFVHKRLHFVCGMV